MKPVLDSLDDVPDAIHDEYEEKDGKYVLKLDGAPPGFVPAGELAEVKGKVDEFRENNRGLNSEVEALKAKVEAFGDVTPDKVQSLQQRIKEFEDKKGVTKPEDIDAQINQAVEEQTRKAIKPLQDTIEELTEREKQAQQQLRQSRLESTLRDAASKAGVADGAIQDFLNRASRTFTVTDKGDVVAEQDGRTVYDDSTGKALTPEVWASEHLRKEAPHLFKANKGGGAGGGPGGGPDGRKTYDPNDNNAFLSNVEDIAKGKAVPATEQ